MRRFLVLLTALCILLTVTAQAAPTGVDTSQKVYDFAGLFTQFEAEELRELATAVTATHNIDTVILTTDDAEGTDSGNYAADFFEYNNFGVGSRYDGILLLFNMDEREVYILESGNVDEFMQRDDNEALLDSLYGEVVDGRYAGAAKTFLRDVDAFFAYRTQTQKDVGVEEALNPPRPLTWQERISGSMIAGMMVAAVAVVVMLLIHLLRGVPKPPSYQAYLGDGQVRFHRREDRFVSTHTTRTARPKDTGGGGGGSRGGSNTFRSSGGGGGRSFGGGGRKF